MPEPGDVEAFYDRLAEHYHLISPAESGYYQPLVVGTRP
jgi:hypothetical protein